MPSNQPILREINEIRNNARPRVGSNDIPLAMAEKLFNIKPVEILSVEPDPRYFDGYYYYNSKLNKLYRKLSTTPVPVWRPIG